MFHGLSLHEFDHALAIDCMFHGLSLHEFDHALAIDCIFHGLSLLSPVPPGVVYTNIILVTKVTVLLIKFL